MMNTDFRARFTTVDRRTDQVVVKEKGFKTAEARAKFLNKLDDDGKLVETLATSDPR